MVYPKKHVRLTDLWEGGHVMAIGVELWAVEKQVRMWGPAASWQRPYKPGNALEVDGRDDRWVTS